MRNDGRKNNQSRNIKIIKNYTMHAEGSVLYCQGNTRVLCNATVEDRVPPHVFGTGKGWVTAEYSMLPRATLTRNQRDVSKLKLSPRSTEIQRLIGRALRGCIDLEKLGERSIVVDCDVIQADGGTRCASITGGFVALCLAIKKLMAEGLIAQNPITKQVAALSVGIVGGEAVCDLCYEEDCRAGTDMNVIMTSNGGFIEVQGTAEHAELTRGELNTLLDIADEGMKPVFAFQRAVLEDSLLIATNNAHKVEEFKKICDTLGVGLVTPKQLGVVCDPDEDGDTFKENAMIKARAFYNMTGLSTVADDSGLCVNALGGAPGIYSARYGNKDTDGERLLYLLDNMKDKDDRTAYFVSAIACVLNDSDSFAVEGRCEGSITAAPDGECGFGYDPVFLPNGKNETFAKMSGEQKNKISHRAVALEKFASVLKEKI